MAHLPHFPVASTSLKSALHTHTFGTAVRHSRSEVDASHVVEVEQTPPYKGAAAEFTEMIPPGTITTEHSLHMHFTVMLVLGFISSV